METKATVREMLDKWRKKGEQAGKTEGWMNLEETLAETLRDHPHLSESPEDLVQTAIEGWEETTHFEMLYGSNILDDAKEAEGDEGEAWLDTDLDGRTEFWEGYLNGRASIGRDVYALARKLLNKKHSAGGRRATKKSSRRAASHASMGGLR